MKQSMTKRQLTEALRKAGVMVRTKAPKAELEAEYEKLHTQKEKAESASSNKPKRQSYTRAHALKEALAEGGTRQEITDRLDALYVEHGGQSHERGAKATTDMHLPVLQIFGVVKKDGDTYRLKM